MIFGFGTAAAPCAFLPQSANTRCVDATRGGGAIDYASFPGKRIRYPALVALNNKYVRTGLTLTRTEEFAYAHLADYRVVRDADGGVVACAALDEYSPTVVELVSLAVTQDAQGLGYGKSLIAAIEKLALKRGYEQLFAVSYSDEFFLSCGFEHAELREYPEKIARYARWIRVRSRWVRSIASQKNSAKHPSDSGTNPPGAWLSDRRESREPRSEDPNELTVQRLNPRVQREPSRFFV